MSSDYDGVYLIPKGVSHLKSRNDVDLKDRYGLYPIISSPMKGISGKKLVIEMGRNNCLGILHRFDTPETRLSNILEIAESPFQYGVAIGVNNWDEEFSIAKYAVNHGCTTICLDIANGYLSFLENYGQILKKTFGNNVRLMCGNVVTKEGAQHIKDCGFDMVRVGIGGGCFGAKTRILMANGTYKNIEDIRRNDIIIGGDGKPCVVKNVFCTGLKDTIEIKNNSFHKSTLVTPDHKYFVSDQEFAQDYIRDSLGFKKMFQKGMNRWKQIKDCRNDLFLFPAKIKFELPETFSIEIKKGNGGIDNKLKDMTLTPSYDIGYIFGMFLGNGCSNQGKHNNSHSGSVQWTQDIKDQEEKEKLSNCIKSVFEYTPHESVRNNTWKLSLYYKPFADFLLTFGKRDKKHLPENLLVNNADYLRGLYDGLNDSDGHFEESGQRYSFDSTSEQLIELWSILNYIIFGYLPILSEKKKGCGNLVGAKESSLKQDYCGRTLKNYPARVNEKYCLLKHSFSENSKKTLVYDIEIEENHHSFVANNTIVHNSLCITRKATGVGRNQLMAIKDCSEIDVDIVADGGIDSSGKMTKAIFAGADYLMVGTALGYALEAENTNGLLYGMASSLNHINNNKEIKSIEGIEKIIDNSQKKPLKEILDQFLWGIRSCCTYLDCNSYREIPYNSEMIGEFE